MRPFAQPVDRRQSVLRTTTLREFDGGWNVIDNDLSLSAKFAKVFDNVIRKDDRSIGIRWGTQLFADLSGSTSADIINIEYFQDHLIVVMSDGELYYVDSDGNETVLWDSTIASWQGVAAWTTTDFASMASFNGQLIVCNGIDKPLLVDLNNAEAKFRCQYLQDLGTSSNANVPIGRYVSVVNDYVLIAGDPLEPGRVHISNIGTSGTWYGDAAPNDATYVDVDKKVHTNTGIINGIARYRDKVVVAFDEVTVLGTLGIYDGSSNHTPSFDEVYHAHGSIAHRSMQHLGDDLLMVDSTGAPSLRRTTFTDSISPDRPSELIDPAMAQNLGQLTVGTLLKDVWSVYNHLERQYMVFVPNHDANMHTLETDPFTILDVTTEVLAISIENHLLNIGDEIVIAGATGFNQYSAGELNTTHTIATILDDDTVTVITSNGGLRDYEALVGGGASVTGTANRTESTGYVMVYRSSGKIVKAWSRFKGWNFSCGCRSILGNIFFGEHGGQKIYLYGNTQNPLYADFINDNQTDISWAWETPWAAMDQRGDTKKFRYIGLDTRGTAAFTIMQFVDDLYVDEFGNLDPDVSMDMVGGDTGGFGRGTQNYGTGRRTDAARLYNWTTKGKLVKLRIEGTTSKPLRIISVILSFMYGTIRR